MVANGPIPANWQSFLCHSENKKEVAQMTTEDNKVVYSTHENQILSTDQASVPDELISDCNHEEADTRIMLHLKHCIQNGYRCVMIKTVDTDVVVPAVATFVEMQQLATRNRES